MGLHRRTFSYVIAILLVNPFIGVHAATAIYTISWTTYDENIPIPFSTYFDIYYDPIESQGILTSHIITIQGFNFQYSFVHGDIDDAHFETIPIPTSSVPFYQFIDSTYLSQPNSIIMMGHTNNPLYTGLTEVLIKLEEFEFTFNSIPYPDFPPSGSSMIDIGSNQEANQLLLIASDDNGPLSLIYDYTDRQWIELGDDILNHPGRSGDMAISSERNEAIYFNSLDTILSGENATYIFDFETLNWSAVNGSIVPGPLISYDIVYHPVVEQYVLLGGFKLPQSTPNNDVWMFDPTTRQWSLLFEELSVLSHVEKPKYYYDSTEDKVVGFGRSTDISSAFRLFSIKMEKFLSGVKIDFGIPTPIILAATGITLGIGLFIVIAILLVKRRS